MSSVLYLTSRVAASFPRLLKGDSGAGATLQTLLARLIIIALNIATGIITARNLGPEGRGELAAMIIWSTFLANSLTLGLPSSLVYNFKHHPEEKSELFSAALLLGTMLGITASLIGVALIPFWLTQYSAKVVGFAQLLMLSVPALLLLQVFSAAFEASGDFTTSNQIRCLSPLVTLLALCLLLFGDQLTPFSAAVSYAMLGSLPVYWLLIPLWRLFRPRWRNMKACCSRLLSYGARSYGNDLLNTAAAQVDQLLVIGLMSPASMGIYVVAVSFARMLNVLQLSVAIVLFPRAAARPAEEVVALTGQAARVSATLTLLVGIVVMIFGPVLLRLLYGSEFVEAVPVLRLLVIEVLFGGTAWVLMQTFMALGRPGTVTILQGTGFALALPLILMLVPVYGLMGAGFALLCSSAVRLALTLLSFPLLLKVHPPSLLITRGDILLLKQKFNN